MKIKEILKEYNIIPKNDIINMGIMNGWNENYSIAYKKLKAMSIQGTSVDKELGRCYTENSVNITDGEDTFTLITRVDSGD